MRKLGMLVAAIAVAGLGFGGTASAQSLRDAPAGGGEVCDGAEGFEGQAGPFEPVRAGFVENGCAGGEDGGDGGEQDGGEEGGEESNPFCDGLAQAPEEMAPLTGPLGEGGHLRCRRGAGERRLRSGGRDPARLRGLSTHPYRCRPQRG